MVYKVKKIYLFECLNPSFSMLTIRCHMKNCQESQKFWNSMNSLILRSSRRLNIKQQSEKLLQNIHKIDRFCLKVLTTICGRHYPRHTKVHKCSLFYFALPSSRLPPGAKKVPPTRFEGLVIEFSHFDLRSASGRPACFCIHCFQYATFTVLFAHCDWLGI